MLMRKEIALPVLFALAAVAMALGVANMLLAYSMIVKGHGDADSDQGNSMYPELHALEERYSTMDERIDDVHNRIDVLRGDMDRALNEIRSILVSQNGSYSSHDGNDGLKHLLEYALEKREERTVQAEDRGDFRLTYVDDERYSSLQSMLKRSGIIESQIEMLNLKFRLPYDISVVVAESHRCGNASGYYEQMSKSITLCYSSLNNFVSLYPDSIEGFSTLLKFLLYHEVAHALMDAYELPIVGMQEYAADNFAIVMMLSNDYDIRPVILLYDAMREDRGGGGDHGVRYWDTHMLFVQRYYDILCLAHGSDPSEYPSNDLPAERAYRCSHEYSSALKAWNELLRPWMNDGKLGE